MVFRINYTKKAAKVMARLPKDIRELIESKLRGVAADPGNAASVKSLTNRPDYRLRVGDWRVIFNIDHGEMVIAVIKVASRGEVYKK